jgi:hypothetical protein
VSDLLLHSLAEFGEIILPSLDLVGARSVVEIGSEEGLFTRELLAWAEARGAAVTCVDPAPSDGLVSLVEGSSAGELLTARSLDALADLGPADVYLVDGDHNYYTVSKELRLLFEETDGGPPLAFVHDVGWPAGRRDMYYSPEGLPAEAVHPHDYAKGAVVGRSELVAHGFRGAGQFAWARHEGGPANGVLTAVEDFLSEHPHVELHKVPCIFGLGVLFDRESPYAGELRRLLGPHEGSRLLERLERNRLDLFLRVLEMQDGTAELERAVEDWSLRTRDVEVENRALWGRVRELEKHVAEVAREVDAVVRARSFAVAEVLSRFHGRFGDQRGLSRQRLRQVLEANQSAAAP